MKNFLAITLVLVIISALIFVVYHYAIKPPKAPVVIPNATINPTTGNVTLPSQLSAETLGKIQTACTAPSSKLWFENTYKTKCANFGF